MLGTENVSAKEAKASRQAALLRIVKAKHANDYQQVGELISQYEPEFSGRSSEKDLLVQKIDLQTYQGNYAEAQNTLEKVQKLSDSENAYPTLEKILAEQAGQTQNSQTTASGELKESGDAPSSFRLEAAYPNPFNPTTTVPFTLAEKAQVKIEVFNMMGRNVATLTNNSYETGRHQVVFEGQDMASGIYIIKARIQTENNTFYSFNRKVTLLK